MVLHMVANVKAVRCLELTSVNRMRADIIVSDFVQSKVHVTRGSCEERERVSACTRDGISCLYSRVCVFECLYAVCTLSVHH